MRPKSKLSKRRNFIQLLVLVLLGGLVLFSLVMPGLSMEPAKRPAMEISVLLREDGGSVWSNMRMGMEQAAYDLGVELRFLVPNMNNDHETQKTLVLREVDRGTDALVLAPADATAMAQLLHDEAPELSVVSIESPLSPDRACIAPDNNALGSQLAAVCESGGQPVLLLDTAGESSGVRQRLDSCASALEAAGVTIEQRTVATGELREQMEPLLAETKAGAVIAFEHSTTELLSSLPLWDTVKIPLYGVGATNAIVASLEKETLRAVAVWSDYAVGYLAVQAAVNTRPYSKTVSSGQQMSFRIVKGADIYEKDNQKLLFPVVS